MFQCVTPTRKQEEALDNREEPQGRSPYGEEPRGSSPQGDSPRQDTSTERWWEEHRSSPGSPDEPEEPSAAPHTQEQQDPDDDVDLEAAAALWETEEVEEDEHDPVIDRSLPHQHRPRIPGFCTRPGSYAHDHRTER